MDQGLKSVYPKIIDDLLTNPGIGFIAAPPLMGGLEIVRDNRGEIVEAYKFTQDSVTNNHPDSQVYYCGARWKDIEPEEGVYNWESLDAKLEKAQSMGCTAVVRIAPYALAEEEDIPAWLRSIYPEEPEFPFWRIDPNTTQYPQYWAKLIRAFGARYDGNPILSSVDMAIVGAWGEGGGTEFLAPESMDHIIRAYMESFKVTPLQALLHDPASLACIQKYNTDVGFRVDCLGDMGGFHGEEWSHMLDFYPQNIQNFNMGDAWKRAPIVFEACWHMNDWYLSGWDIDYIIEESLKWHISSFNSKATTVPIAWKDRVAQWVKKMGYRYELRKFSYTGVVHQGGVLRVQALLANVGVAPCYHPYPVVLRLSDVQGKYIELPLDVDIRSWLPDRDILMDQTVLLPEDIPAGEYEIQFGITTSVKEIGNIKLAIEGRNQDGFYPMGKLSIKQGGKSNE